MERRHYRTTLTPEDLGQAVISHVEGQRRTDSQLLGSGDSVMVQIKHGREGRELDSLSVGIARDPDHPDQLMVTQGEQQWFTSRNVAGVAGHMIGALWSPWALFGLLWPAKAALSDLFRPGEIWQVVDNEVVTRGGELLGSKELTHPHTD